MSLISACLGLLTPWLIVQLCLCGGAHLYVFVKALKMRNDQAFYRSLPNRNKLELANQNGQPSNGGGLIGGVPRAEVYDRNREQRAKIFEESR